MFVTSKSGILFDRSYLCYVLWGVSFKLSMMTTAKISYDQVSFWNFVNRLRLQHVLCDMEIVVLDNNKEKQHIPVHKLIIAYYCQILHSETSSTELMKRRRIDLSKNHNVSYEGVQKLLAFVYRQSSYEQIMEFQDLHEAAKALMIDVTAVKEDIERHRNSSFKEKDMNPSCNHCKSKLPTNATQPNVTAVGDEMNEKEADSEEQDAIDFHQDDICQSVGRFKAQHYLEFFRDNIALEIKNANDCITEEKDDVVEETNSKIAHDKSAKEKSASMKILQKHKRSSVSGLKEGSASKILSQVGCSAALSDDQVNSDTKVTTAIVKQEPKQEESVEIPHDPTMLETEVNTNNEEDSLESKGVKNREHRTSGSEQSESRCKMQDVRNENGVNLATNEQQPTAANTEDYSQPQGADPLNQHHYHRHHRHHHHRRSEKWWSWQDTAKHL